MKDKEVHGNRVPRNAEPESPNQSPETPTFDTVYGHLTDDERMLEAARVLCQQGQIRKSVAFYQEACRRMPARVDAQRELATVLLAQALRSWLPWEKRNWFREADKTGCMAIQLGDSTGDSHFVVAEANAALRTDRIDVPQWFFTALELYQGRLRAGETVGSFYTTTAMRLAQYYESTGDYRQARIVCEIVADAPHLERTGKLTPGSATPQKVAWAQATIIRLSALQAKQAKGGVR